MARRVGSVAALVAALLAAGAACGATGSTASTAQRRSGGLVVRVTSTPSPPRHGRRVVWHVRVTNTGREPVLLEFPTSQRADVVLRRGGAVRYRWSDGLMFAQMVGQLGVAPGRSRTFDLPGPLHVPAGRYVLVASLTARPAPPAARVRVTVR